MLVERDDTRIASKIVAELDRTLLKGQGSAGEMKSSSVRVMFFSFFDSIKKHNIFFFPFLIIAHCFLFAFIFFCLLYLFYILYLLLSFRLYTLFSATFQSRPVCYVDQKWQRCAHRYSRQHQIIAWRWSESKCYFLFRYLGFSIYRVESIFKETNQSSCTSPVSSYIVHLLFSSSRLLFFEDANC